MNPDRIHRKNQSDSRCTPRSTESTNAAATVHFPDPGGPDTITTSPFASTPQP